MSFLRGTLALFLLVLNLIVSSSIILLFAAISNILPGKAYRAAMSFTLKLPIYWMIINKWILKMNTHGKWDIEGSDGLNPNGWYLIISNHTSWIDIPVLGSVFSGKTPLLKFFMKKELLWQLPIAGIVCFLLGYPILSRHTRAQIRKKPALKGKDIEATKKACQKFKEFPTTLMNFVEGTRFTKAKQEQQASHYQNLLKPKAAGTAIVLTEMADKLNGIVNVTIHYDAKDNSLWRFLCGKVKKIYIRYEVISVTEDLIGNYYEDRQYRKRFQQWLNQLWQQKDYFITSLKLKKSS